MAFFAVLFMILIFPWFPDIFGWRVSMCGFGAAWRLTLGVMSRAIADKGGNYDPVTEGINEAAKHVAKLKFIDGAFGSAKGELEGFRNELAEWKNTVMNAKKSRANY